VGRDDSDDRTCDQLREELELAHQRIAELYEQRAAELQRERDDRKRADKRKDGVRGITPISGF
jgi:hypothetical protein